MYAIAASVIVVSSVSACSSNSSKNGADGGASGAGPVGSGGSAAGGASAQSAGGSGSNANSVGSGQSGGAGGGGGSGGTGQAAGGSSNAADAQASTDGGGPRRLDDLPGPTAVDQAPIVIAKSYIMDSASSAIRAFSDASGNLFIAGSAGAGTDLTGITFVTEYGPALAKKWTNSSLAPGNYASADGGAFVKAASLGADDTIFFGGYTVPTMVTGGDKDALVGKLDSTGNEVWLKQWGGTGDDIVNFVAPGPGGGVLATGTSGGQTPGNPPSNAGGNFATRYESDGTRTWLLQYPTSVSLVGKLFSDSSGDLYSGSGHFLNKVDPSGQLLGKSTTEDSSGPIPIFGLGGLGGDAIFARGEESFYNFYDGYSDPSHPLSPPPSPALLSQTGVDGKVAWYRVGAKRSATIDPVEGVIWNGTFSRGSSIPGSSTSITVTGDSIYISGIYLNSYMNGSAARPSTNPGFVGRYDLNGNQLWFQEFLFDQLSNLKFPGSFAGLGVDENGNVIAVVNGIGKIGWYVFKLSKADGSLL